MFDGKSCVHLREMRRTAAKLVRGYYDVGYLVFPNDNLYHDLKILISLNCNVGLHFYLLNEIIFCSILSLPNIYFRKQIGEPGLIWTLFQFGPSNISKKL